MRLRLLDPVLPVAEALFSDLCIVLDVMLTP
jgi:hypothetical protein